MKNNTYHEQLIKSISCINISELIKAKNKFVTTCKSGNFIFCCGNGGSASISNHFQVDALKGIYERKKIKSKFISLSSNIETITAISNDIGYDKMNIILGVSSIFVGIIKSIDTYFQLGKRSESHRLCSLQFMQITKKLQIEL
jgi:hypothetical protein